MDDAMTGSAPIAGGKLAPNSFVAAISAARQICLRAAFFSLFVNLLMLTGPIYMLQIYDRILSSRSYETLIVITVLTFALFAAMAALDHVRNALLARTAGAFDEKLRSSAFDMARLDLVRPSGLIGVKKPVFIR